VIVIVATRNPVIDIILRLWFIPNYIYIYICIIGDRYINQKITNLSFYPGEKKNHLWETRRMKYYFGDSLHSVIYIYIYVYMYILNVIKWRRRTPRLLYIHVHNSTDTVVVSREYYKSMCTTCNRKFRSFAPSYIQITIMIFSQTTTSATYWVLVVCTYRLISI